jgi:hypothetical protein
MPKAYNRIIAVVKIVVEMQELYHCLALKNSGVEDKTIR